MRCSDTGSHFFFMSVPKGCFYFCTFRLSEDSHQLVKVTLKCHPCIQLLLQMWQRTTVCRMIIQKSCPRFSNYKYFYYFLFRFSFIALIPAPLEVGVKILHFTPSFSLSALCYCNNHEQIQDSKRYYLVTTVWSVLLFFFH